MTLHIKMDDKVDADRLEEMVQGVVGEPLDRPDGPLKVSGTAPYAMDALPDGSLFGVLVRSTVPAGRMTGADSDAIEALPGIRAVVIDDRFLRNPLSNIAPSSIPAMRQRRK